MRQSLRRNLSPRIRQRLSAFAASTLLLVGFIAHAAESIRPEISLFDEALTVSKQLDPDTDPDACRRAFNDLAVKIRASLDAAKAKDPEQALTPEATVAVLNQEILLGREVSYISNKYWRDSIFTSALLKNRGNCASTALLYYLLGQELKLPIVMTFLPEHAFARWDDGKTVINIETTNKGIALTNEKLMQRYDLSQEDLEPNRFLITLTDTQIRAHMRSLWSSVLYSLDRRDEAWKFLDAARASDPECPTLLLQEASYRMREGQIEKAKAIFDTITKNASGPWAQASSKISYAAYLEMRGKIDEALELLRADFNAAPQGMKIQMAKLVGLLYRHKRDFEQAIPFYVFVAQNRPDEKNIAGLGSVLSEARHNEEAVRMYEQALKMNPESFYSQLELAVLYDRVGNKEKGKAMFAKLEEPRDNKLHWHRCMAFYFANVKDEDKMIEHMTSALKMDASGDTYQYFIREQDMDLYRDHEAFKALMAKNNPTRVFSSEVSRK